MIDDSDDDGNDESIAVTIQMGMMVIHYFTRGTQPFNYLRVDNIYGQNQNERILLINSLIRDLWTHPSIGTQSIKWKTYHNIRADGRIQKILTEICDIQDSIFISESKQTIA